MQKYEYKCVPGPQIVSVDSKTRNSAVSVFEDIINKEAIKGWEFVCIDSYTTEEPQGCFGIGKPIITSYKMIVFKREVNA